MGTCKKHAGDRHFASKNKDVWKNEISENILEVEKADKQKIIK